MNISNKGFAPIIILIAVLLIAGLGGYVYFQSKNEPTISTTTTVTDSNIITTTTTTAQPITTTTTLTNVIDWSCGNPVTFTYKGEIVTYGTVESKGRCWLDRNLGTNQVATAYDDSEAYGDLFQWGRLDDGHQDRYIAIAITNILSTSDNPGHSNFIYGMGPPYDWRNPQNDNLWQGVSGINNPCPSGWRLPTEAEWGTELASWGQTNYNGAFASSLKLTAGGLHLHGRTGPLNFNGAGSGGYYWSSSVSGTNAYYIYFLSDDADMRSTYRAIGLSVRCIKN
jgi:uncharacterized protein (TIGR02145 family)